MTIRKPGLDDRKSFWKADAWHAASAEPVFRWGRPGSRHPRLARAANMAVLAMFAAMAFVAGGPAALGVTAGLIVGVALVGSGLRRVLMYLSLRRYGEWQDMPPEMRAALDRKTDLAEPPAPFKPLPRGYRPRVEGVADTPPATDGWPRNAAKVGMVFVALPVLGTIATLSADDPRAAACLFALAVLAVIGWQRYDASREAAR